MAAAAAAALIVGIDDARRARCIVNVVVSIK